MWKWPDLKRILNATNFDYVNQHFFSVPKSWHNMKLRFHNMFFKIINCGTWALVKSVYPPSVLALHPKAHRKHMGKPECRCRRRVAHSQCKRWPTHFQIKAIFTGLCGIIVFHNRDNYIFIYHGQSFWSFWSMSVSSFEPIVPNHPKYFVFWFEILTSALFCFLTKYPISPAMKAGWNLYSNCIGFVPVSPLRTSSCSSVELSSGHHSRWWDLSSKLVDGTISWWCFMGIFDGDIVHGSKRNGPCTIHLNLARDFAFWFWKHGA